LLNIFRKSWNIFLKTKDIWNPKLFPNSIIYYLFFFILLAFFTSFFPISPNQTCQKLLNSFLVFYYTDYRDIVNTKHFQNSIVYYLLFNFLVFFTSFFLFFLFMVLKKFLKVVFFYCMDPRFYQKILQNYGFFFQKNWDIWNPKFQENSIVYYFFFIFLAFLAFFLLFHLSKLVKKFWNFFKCFIQKNRDFINEFLKFLKVLLQKYRYVK